MKNILTIILTLFVLTSFGQTRITDITNPVTVNAGPYLVPPVVGISFSSIDSSITLYASIDTAIEYVFVVDDSGFVKRRKVWGTDYWRDQDYINSPLLPSRYLDFDTKKEIKDDDLYMLLKINNRPIRHTIY